MITVAEVVRQLISNSPFIEEGLSQGLINLSSLARRLQPEINKKLYKEIKVGAIVMALKRLESKLSLKSSKLEQILNNLGNITIRSNLLEITYLNSSTISLKQSQLLQKAKSLDTKSFLTLTDGVFETSIFASQNFQQLVEETFAGEKLRSKISNLSSITIIIPEEATYIPGVYYSILKKLAWEGINFIEVISSFTELTLFLEDKDIDKAFSALKKLK